MTTNQIYAHTESLARVITVGNDVAPGTPGRTAAGEPYVTLTGSGDHKPQGSVLLPDGTEAAFDVRSRGGVGLADDEATVAFDGTFAFPVTGTPADGDIVYLTGSGTLSKTGTDVFGVVEFARPASGDYAVKIGNQFVAPSAP